MQAQTCPRRMLESGPWKKEENLDSWIGSPRRKGEVLPACSFCGSLHPEKFLELISRGWEVGPTDKDYKAYLNSPREEGDDSSDEVSSGRWAKFYYLHLSVEQCHTFVNLYNGQVMRIGYPGRFYVMPFFMQTEPPSVV